MKIKIRLNNIENAKEFVNICNQFKEMDINYIIGSYCVDAKSVMGVLSASLCHTASIELLNKANRKSIDLFCELISKWIVEV